MRNDHKPFALKRLLAKIERFWINHFVRPQLESLGDGCLIMKPWYLHLYGAGISFGDAIHVVTSRDRTVRLTTWEHENGAGQINIQDHALLCPGVRIDSATSVNIGRGTMLAAGAYLTDADWHGVYDRSKPIGQTKAIHLDDNVWIGDGAIVCKGVSIGTNSIVGAGSVVTKSLPANVIAAGNPAVVVKELDQNEPRRTRSDLLSDYVTLQHDVDLVDQALRQHNTWTKWLRTVFAPNTQD